MPESLSIILTLLIAGALIGGIDFVWSNLDDTLDDSSDQLANGEGLASAGGKGRHRETWGDGAASDDGLGTHNIQERTPNNSRPLGEGV